MNKDFLIIYHSGAGNTKLISEVFYKLLAEQFSVDMTAVTPYYDYSKLDNYNVLIFAYPCYHCEPSASMLDFIEKIPSLKEPKKAYSIVTCGLYSANTSRILSKRLKVKHIFVQDYAIFRAPATDAQLLLPQIKFFHEFPKNTREKIEAHIIRMKQVLLAGLETKEVCRFKIHSILNAPNKFTAKKMMKTIYVDTTKCINCSLCTRTCIRGAWTAGITRPHFQLDACENCYQCIHHCPAQALILDNKTGQRKKFNTRYYMQQKAAIMNKESIN